MIVRIFSAFALITVFSGANPASPNEVQALVKRVEARYRSAKTLEATFLERYSENGREARTESGKAYFHRPGKMRWEYQAPENDVFLVDGKTAWFYVPADHTVTRVPAKLSTDFRTPMALLAGEMKISRVCSRVELSQTEKAGAQGHAMLYCALRGSEQRASQDHSSSQQVPAGIDEEAVFFEVAPDSGELVRILLRQSGGVQLEFRFADWRFDPPLPTSMFRFEVPPGVAIVNGDSAVATPGAQ